MESFFSLFDPSEGQNKPKKQRHKNVETLDTVKKKAESKGRRSNKKNQGKNETLPEESSFLCDPNLSTDILVKDGSYIESFMASNEAYKEELNKKPRRKNSNRKNRRKKNKVSPAKDLIPNSNGWSESIDNIDDVNWNNKCNLKQKRTEEIGKNVNDLHKEVNSIIDNFEKIGIQDDEFMDDDFNENLNEFYSSDDMDGSAYDSSSDLEDSGEESFGSLPPEPRFGNVEYKLQLVNPSEKRFQHLVTQLKWRLRSGGGSAVYVVGVRDSGALRGLSAAPLRSSLRTLRAMAAALNARVEHVAVRRVAARRAVAEVAVRKLADTQSVELRVAVMGANEAGKSTLIGVLTQGELDNGRGSARLNMFRHVHEVRSGRTSSLSHEILGFDAQGNVVNYGCSELMTAERIGERSARLVSFLDLAGHHKYQRTTVHGLTGYSPHYAMLVVSATAGINRMSEEHIGLLLALDLPFSIVVTKIDLAPGALDTLMDSIKEILDAAGCAKRPLLITDEHSARTCVSPSTIMLNSLADDLEVKKHESDMEYVPVFPVSCVRGGGLNTLHAYLLALEPPSMHTRSLLEEEPCEFQIDEIFHVGESTGPVVGGLLARGHLYEGDSLLIGPLETGEFGEISVKSIYRNRVPCGTVKAGQSASLGLSSFPPNIRQGMVLIAVPDGYHEKKKINETRCQHVIKKPSTTNNIDDLILSKMGYDSSKKRKNQRRTKDKNILQDLANVENSLAKDKSSQKQNMYKSDSENDIKEKKLVSDSVKLGSSSDALGEGSSESEKENCNCQVDALIEDPSYPRGSMFFQATVRVLRHSTAICPGFQATVHIGNIRQTAVIEGIMSWNSVLRAGESAPVLFRFVRQPEYVRAGRTVLFRAGLGTRGVGRVAQTFPYPHRTDQ